MFVHATMAEKLSAQKDWQKYLAENGINKYKPDWDDKSWDEYDLTAPELNEPMWVRKGKKDAPPDD
jgi:hypothetical protein